jgi:hypothetical protein
MCEIEERADGDEHTSPARAVGSIEAVGINPRVLGSGKIPAELGR